MVLLFDICHADDQRRCLFHEHFEDSRRGVEIEKLKALKREAKKKHNPL